MLPYKEILFKKYAHLYLSLKISSQISTEDRKAFFNVSRKHRRDNKSLNKTFFTEKRFFS